MALAADGATQTIYIKQEGGTLYSQINAGGWNTISSFPITIQNTNATPSANTLKVIFTSDITITDNGAYFACASDGIQFGSESLEPSGYLRIITIDVDNYDGFIQNGTEITPGNSYIRVYNLEINGTGHSLQIGAGWIGMKYYGNGATNNYIINCRSSGDISTEGGGIVGSYSGNNGGDLYIYGCSSTGLISDIAGGIAGSIAGGVTISQCYTIGEISGNGAGGMVGANSINPTITKCYSTGAISGNNSGGIVGANAGSNSVLIENCYSTGDILGGNAGGICGSLGPASGTFTVSIINCYTSGNVTGFVSGGICGLLIPINPGTVNVTIINSYTTGTVSGATGYIIGNVAVINGSSPSPTLYSLVNNFSEAGSFGGNPGNWNSTHAALTLTGHPSSEPGVGDKWASTGSTESYEIANIGYTPYSLTVISANSLIQTYSQTIQVGQSTITAINADASGNAFAILQINGSDPSLFSGLITISQQTGAISTTASTEPGTYTIIVRSIGSYHITTFTLTVTAATIVTVECCAIPMDLTAIDYDIRTKLISGNIIMGNIDARRGAITYSDISRMKMAKAAKY